MESDRSSVTGIEAGEAGEPVEVLITRVINRRLYLRALAGVPPWHPLYPIAIAEGITPHRNRPWDGFF